MSYINGETHHKISNENLVDELEAMIRQKVREKEQAQNNEKSQA
jgi:4-hydroxy-3-methylbut-2-en-1-yl diphosphate synthase IspG/GcpE